jgi:hypothetical protein
MRARASFLWFFFSVLLIASPNFAATPNASAAAALEHLRRVMDRYHDRFIVYEDVSAAGNHFHSWAKIPDQNAAVTMAGSWTDSPHRGATAIRVEFQDTSGANFGGFYLLNGVLGPDDLSPQPNFGTEPNAGIDLTGATALTFWARGQNGGETIELFMGGVGRDPITGQALSPYPDSTPVVKQTFVLTAQWTQYSLDLSGRDLSYVLGGFGWVASDTANPGGAVFFLDDIEYQLSPAARTTRLNQPRFLRSFETEPYQSQPPPVNDFDFVLRNIAFTYDNTLALIAFLAEGSADGLRRARLIGDALVYATEHDRSYDDGRLRDAYAAGDISLPPGWTPNGRTGTVPIPGFYVESTQTFVEIEQGRLSTGNNAWGMLALLALHRFTGDTRYLTAALRIAQFVEQFRQNTGIYQGFRGGLDKPESASPSPFAWASAEHNLDLHAAFSRLAQVTGDPQWLTEAEHARLFLESMWDSSIGCYRAGTIDPSTRNENPGTLPVDVQAWSVLAVPSVLSLHPGVLGCVETHHVTTDQGWTGVDFNEDKDGVWFEGSAQVALAYEQAAQGSSAQTLRSMLAQAQATPPFGDGFGIVAASRDGLTSGFDFAYFRRRHVGATAWNVLAQLVFNPFYARPVHEGEFFTLAPCRLMDTRDAQDGPALTSQVPRLVATLGKCGIPLSAATLGVNVTVVAPTSGGHLTLYPGNQAVPQTSTVNFQAGQTRSNNALLLLAPDQTGTIGLYSVLGGGGTVHVILDVSGYFE